MKWRSLLHNSAGKAKAAVRKSQEATQALKDRLSPHMLELRQKLAAYWHDLNVDALKAKLGPAWAGAADVYASTSQSPHIQKRLRQIQGALGGTVAGAGAGALLGGGGVGIVALGGAIGIPLIVITGLVGMLAGERGGRELDFLRDQWKGAAERTAIAKERLTHAQTPAEAVMTGAETQRIIGHQHYQVLMQSFDSAKKCLCIRSAFISDHVIDDAFVAKVRTTLTRGVDIYIEYGYRLPKEFVKPSRHRERALDALRGLYKWCRHNNTKGNLMIGDTATHIKELIVDDQYIVIGSNNWLSNRSFQNKEVSIKLHAPEMCRTALRETQDSMQHFAKGK